MKAKKMCSLLILLSFLLVSACDNKALEPNEKIEVKIEDPLSGQIKALDKAKELENEVLKKAEQQRKSIEDMTK